jgi:hypothetical protein
LERLAENELRIGLAAAPALTLKEFGSDPEYSEGPAQLAEARAKG